MCGITGIISLYLKENNNVQDILRMTTKLKHRGPDDEGYLFVNSEGSFVFGGEKTEIHINENLPYYFPKSKIDSNTEIKSFLTFGFRRLAIQDLTLTGHQPMSYLKRYWIVFNGEIYNYLELREELIIKGYNFLSNSDAEVILAAYDYYGINCLNKFNGMWAFVIYDSNEKKIFISRDRFGIKPLYYYIDEKKFVFASEIKAILEHFEVNVNLNFNYLEEFVYSYPKEYLNYTAFNNIYRFPKSHYLEISIEELNLGNLVFKKYYQLPNTPINNDFDETKIENLKEQYLKLITDAVNLRLRSDVPVGTTFSGGLDSSTVVYLIYKQLKLSNNSNFNKVFSLVFDSQPQLNNISEKIFIEKFIEQFNIEAYFIEPKLEELIDEYKKTIYSMETPQDDMLLSCMFTYKLVNKHGIKVTLDGQGADELLGGYLRYLTNYFSNLNVKFLLKEYKLFKSIPGAKKEILLGIFFNFIKLLNLTELTKKILIRLDKFKDPFINPNLRMLEDFEQNLENLLKYGDHSSMFYSIESRYPFLDYRLVEFFIQLPYTYKLKVGWTKYLARLTFNGKIPDPITWRKDKMGWEIPQNYWFEMVFRDYAFQIISSSEIIKLMKLEKFFEKNWKRRNKRNVAFKNCIKLFNLCLWYDIFFQKVRYKLE